MEITIRRAEKRDCVRLLQLIQELAEYEKAPNEVTVTLSHFEESGFGANPVWWAFVAEVEGVVVGMALYYVRYSTWKGQRMYLEDIFTAAANLTGHPAISVPAGTASNQLPMGMQLIGRLFDEPGLFAAASLLN